VRFQVSGTGLRGATVGAIMTLSVSLAGGGCVAAKAPAEGDHLRRLVPGTWELCVRPPPCPGPPARPRGGRAAPDPPFPPAGRTCAGLGGSAPIYALRHGRAL